MSVFLWVVVVALGVALFAFSVYAFAEGGLGMLEGARFERCPRCGRHGAGGARPAARWRLPAPLGTAGLCATCGRSVRAVCISVITRASGVGAGR